MKIKGICLPRKKKDPPKIISEYLCNGSLRPVIGSSTAPEWWNGLCKVKAILGIVHAMRYVHFKGIIHRDLKPENILLQEDYEIRIADFGSSRIFEADVTMTDAGTPLYMAPEVGSGHYDRKIDVYSFGLILYEIVTSNPIFSCRESDKSVLYAQLRTGWRPDIGADVTKTSRSLIERCWSIDPSKRPNFFEIWKLLKEYDFGVIPGVGKSEIEPFLTFLTG
jgi:serine/threonine protein kinase